MAWALQFDGVNDYVSFNSISLSGDFDVYIDVTLDVLLDAYHGILSRNNSSGNGTLRANGSSVGIITSEGVFRQFSLPGGAIPSDGSRFYFRISRVGSTLTLRDLILEQDSSSVFTDTGTFTFSNFGRRNGQYFSGSLLNLQVVDGAATTNNYDPTASDHSPGAQPVLTDTVGSNDAQGFNFATDGSAWIDLGGGLSRVFIDLTGPSRYYQSTQWIPASTFKISFKVAATSSGTSEYFDIGMFKLRVVSEQFIVLTPDDAGAGGTIGFTLASPLVIDDLNEFIITGDTNSTLVGLSVNGVASTPTSTSTDTPNFAGGFIIGSTSSGSIAPEVIIADFKVEDLTNSSNTYTWAIDQETANSEDAIEGGESITYVGIPTGLPTRELFTYNSIGPVWDGNNGTTLTIAYPLPPTGIVIDVDTGQLSLTGNPIDLQYTPIVNTEINLDTGTLSLTGQSLALIKSNIIDVSAGLLSLSGSQLSLSKDSSLNIDTGNLSLSGGDLNLIKDAVFNVDSGNLSFTGQEVTLTYTPIGNIGIDLDAGQISLTGEPVALNKSSAVNLDTGLLNLTGSDLDFLKGKGVDLSTGSLSLTGESLALIKSNRLNIDGGELSLNGSSLTLTYSGLVIIEVDNFTLSYTNDTIQPSYTNNQITLTYK